MGGGSTNTVRNRLEQELTRRIDSGRLKAGDRLPPVDQLARTIHAHPISVQKALRQLKEKGVLERIPKLGTFVRQGRDLFRAAVVFGPSLTEESAHFYRALLNALRQERPHPGWSCFSYDGLNMPEPSGSGGEHPALRHFAGDVDHYAFRGLIGIALNDLQWDRIRKAAAGSPHARFSAGGDVEIDFAHFGRASADCLIRAGARRIAYLRTLWPASGSAPPPDVAALRQAASVQSRVSVDIIQFPAREPHYDERVDAEFCLDLVRRWDRAGAWPDAFCMSDDVSMRGLAHALISRGGRRSGQFRIVSWANRGIRLHYGLPVIRYELDPADAARALAQVLVARGEGRDPGPVRIRGTVIENET